MDDNALIHYINLKLAALGQPIFGTAADAQFVNLARPLLRNHQQKNRLLRNYSCPADFRIEEFLNSYLSDVPNSASVKLPSAFVLDRAGIARALSLPPDRDIFSSELGTSYRVKQGVLHNPRNDRRTTQGVFHVAEGGLPIPEDKIAVPKPVFAALLRAALRTPDDALTLPFTSSQPDQARLWASLLLRPIVCPKAGTLTEEKRMEVRFFAPGSLVSNLDFVETIFGNGGDPFLPENDAALDVDGWTGHTGCVILAPHLTKLKKKDLGLPSFEEATERQKRDGACWKSPDEFYNDGGAFKITCRDARGVIVTIIADSYFGYCKKEVKTQISFAANLYGLAEEEHSGGAVAYASYILGREFDAAEFSGKNGYTFENVARLMGNGIDVKADGYGVDRQFPSIIYVPENAQFAVKNLQVSWSKNGVRKKIKLLAEHHYILPSGYKVRLERQIGGRSWRLVGTVAEGAFCHKPSTVSGGGKSEISKSLAYAMLQGPVFVRDIKEDFDAVEKIFARDFTTASKVVDEKAGRPILDHERSLGSVIKLFTPSAEYTDEHNAWLKSIPQTVRQLVFVVKRYYKPEWEGNWRPHFSVDRINGFPGNELKYDDQNLVANYLRMGHEKDGSWRIFKVRTDFNPADKVQVEDDITASVVVPREALADVNPSTDNPSVKVVTNCENMLFQRPDDAIIRGYDIQAEADIATPNTFLSNWEPLTRKAVQDIVENAIGFAHYTEPMRALLKNFLNDKSPAYVVSSSDPRLVDGKPSKNPRYLQNRPDRVNAAGTHLANVGKRLSRGLTADQPVQFSVDAVLAGRRNNGPDRKNGIPPLAVYSPIHYQELPELFMDFISSLTGKSPSTTGFGSEGALTKGPFNAVWPVVDLNNALVSYILTGYSTFTTSAGTVGPRYRVDHDISLLVTEIWCRLKGDERNARYLIDNGYLERVNDFDHKGRNIPASVLGYRITERFVERLMGRIFELPNMVFTEEILRPELQDKEMFAEGVENIVATYKRVAENYMGDGSVDAACPPLKALLHIMATGSYQGKGVNDPEIRALFTRENLMTSEWYDERLKARQKRDAALYARFVKHLSEVRERDGNEPADAEMNLSGRLEKARRRIIEIESPEYLKRLRGTIGADPFHLQLFLTKKEKTLAVAR